MRLPFTSHSTSIRRRRRGRPILILALAVIAVLIILGRQVHAQGVTFNAKVDRTSIAMDESFTLTLEVAGPAGDLPKPNLPDLKEFEVVSTRSYTSTNIVNWKASYSFSYSYILQPLKVGKFSIPATSINYKGQSISTRPIEITVTAGQGGKTARTPQGGASTKRNDSDVSGNMFCKLSADRTDAWVGQKILLTFSFFYRMNLWSQPGYTPPVANGFWIEEAGSSKQPFRKIINGKEYLVQEVNYVLFPTQSGDLTIDPAKLNVQPDPFSAPRMLSTNAVKIHVKQLPTSGRPSDFSGAVGHYTAAVTLSTNTPKAGDAFSYKLTIDGKGNLKTISEPKIPFPSDFKQYETKRSDDFGAKGGEISGRVTFDYTLVSRGAGSYTIPAYKFSYFDPDKGSYVTSEVAGQSLTVSPGEFKEGDTRTAIDRGEVATLRTDIQYIKPDRKNLAGVGSSCGGPLLWGWWLLCLAVLGTSILLKRKAFSDQSNIAATLSRKAFRTARAHLDLSQTAIKRQDASTAYQELANAVFAYIGYKLNRAPAGLVLESVRPDLREHGIAPELIERIDKVVEAAHFARYAPSGELVINYEAQMREIQYLLLEMEKGWRNA